MAVKNYANPLFPAKKRKSAHVADFRFPLYIKLGFLGAVLILVGGVWFALYSDYFVIKNIEAAGQGRLDPRALEEAAWQQARSSIFVFWPRRNILIYDTDRLYEELSNKYFFSALLIEKKLPATLLINYEEEEYALIWQEGDGYFFRRRARADPRSGRSCRIGREILPLDQKRLIPRPVDGKVPVGNDYLKYVFMVFERFKTMPEDLKIRNFIADDEINSVKVKIENGPETYFSLADDLEKQIDKLLTVKNERLKEDFRKMTYIDLRYGDRVYYR
jgi:cell division septal protein FtsQ